MKRRPAAPFIRSLALFLLTAPAAALGQPEQADAEPAAPPIRARPLQGLKAEVAALILAGAEGGQLWAAVLAAPFPGDEGKWNVDFWVEVDGGRLLGIEEGADAGDEAAGDAEDGPDRDGADEVPDAAALRPEVHAYALTSAGALEAHSSDAFRLPAELGARLAEGGVKYAGRLAVAPGEYDLRILVRERRSERFVLRILPLEVPAPDDQRPALLPPFFADVEGAWIEVAGSATPVSPSAPAALPVLGAGRPSTARLRITRPGADGLGVSVRILGMDRRPLGEVEAEVADGPRAPFPELRALDLSFELPDDLLTGNYLLETAVDAEAAPRTTQVYVLGIEREERAIVWTDVRRLASLSERRREALDLAAKRRAKKRVAAIAEAYRDVLGRLASGSIEDAAGELARLEAEVLDTADPDAGAWLAEAEDEVLGELAGRDAESLIPVLFLHMEGHRRYADESAARLARHARGRIIAAARLYAETSRNDMAASLAADVLADMGAALRRARQQVASRRMMDEALALDERNVTALLGIGFDHERRHEYAEAVGCFQRLIEIDPRSEEGRLRLAMSLRRAGDADAAVAHLRRVIDDGTTDWLLAVAYQELARILAERGRFDRAARLLEAGLGRLPAEGRLHLQLAYVLDRMGEGRRARETMRRVPAGRPDSPRLRYGLDLEEDDSQARPVLARQSMARLAVLARALSETERKR